MKLANYVGLLVNVGDKAENKSANASIHASMVEGKWGLLILTIHWLTKFYKFGLC